MTFLRNWTLSCKLREQLDFLTQRSAVIISIRIISLLVMEKEKLIMGD